MGNNKIKVLVIDDSALIRSVMKEIIDREKDMVCVGAAPDPIAAREMIKVLNPDVLTLDVEMPRMDGLEFLERLMRLRPMPVVMVSTQTRRGSTAALEALSLGAVDCISKSGFDPAASFAGLNETLLVAARAQLQTPGARRIACLPDDFRWNGKTVLIGASTGGVDALETVLAGFPANCPPTLITQHMPASFLAGFAQRLATRIAPRIRLASPGAPVEQGQIYLAPGDRHLGLAGGRSAHCQLAAGDKVNGHLPSVEVMFDAARFNAPTTVAVLLTGMGRDGAAAMGRLRQAGARTLAQDEASCVVFGMPRAALETGAAECAVPLQKMAERILELCSARQRAAACAARL